MKWESSPWFRTILSVVFLLQVIWLVLTIILFDVPTRLDPAESWTSDTGSVTKPQQQTLTVTSYDHLAVVNLISNPHALPELELTINGKPARFLVDTGSSVVCLLWDALETFGLRADAEFETDVITARGLHNNVRIGYVKSANFSIGDGTTVQIDNVYVLPPHTGASYQGLLSGAFLKAIGAVIDFRDGTMRLEGHGEKFIHEPTAISP